MLKIVVYLLLTQQQIYGILRTENPEKAKAGKDGKMSRIHMRKDEGGHDFVQIEWTGDAAKRATVRRHVERDVVRALVKLGYSPEAAANWKSIVPDYDPYDKDGCTEVRDVCLYDGESKRNGWSVWDETRDCCDNSNFRYVYFGFSVC